MISNKNISKFTKQLIVFLQVLNYLDDDQNPTDKGKDFLVKRMSGEIGIIRPNKLNAVILQSPEILEMVKAHPNIDNVNVAELRKRIIKSQLYADLKQ